MKKTKIKEEWANIPNYPNYQASNLGRIRNTKTHRIIKSYINKGGYEVIKMSDKGETKGVQVGRLVCLAFHPIPESYSNIKAEQLDADHIDNNRQNNRADNLQWLSHKENIQKALSKCVCGMCKKYMIITDQINKLDGYYNELYPNGFNCSNVVNCIKHNNRKSAYKYKWEYITKEIYNSLKKFSDINKNIIVI